MYSILFEFLIAPITVGVIIHCSLIGWTIVIND